jgi:hypothetical protein
MRYFLWLAAVQFLAACLTGCTPSGSGRAVGDPSVAGDGAGPMRWPYWPTGMRLHPLTRLATDATTGRLVIEARIEFLDREDDTTKGCGQLRIDLHDASDAAGAEPVASWNRDLRDPALNRQYFDDVTRTYLLRLAVESENLPEEPELRAFFLSADGQRLRAELLVRTR